MAGEEPDKATRGPLNIELNAAPTSDASAETVPIVDSQNVVFSPDGSFIRPVGGEEIFHTFDVQTDPPGRIALVAWGSPPEKTDGTGLALAIDTSGDRQAIIAMQDYRDRGVLPSDANTVSIYFDESRVVANYGETVTLNLIRSGSTARAVSCSYSIDPGTAVAGTHYTDESGIVTFGAGENTKTIDIVTLNTAPDINRNFTVFLSSPKGGAVIGTNDSCNVLLQADAALGGRNIVGSGTDPLRLYTFDAITGLSTAHYLLYDRENTGAKVWKGSLNRVIQRVTDKHLLMVYRQTNAAGTSSGTAHAYIYRVADILAVGGAYKTGAAGLSTASKINYAVKLNLTGETNDAFDQFQIIPWTERYAIILGQAKSWIIDLMAGTVAREPSNPTHIPATYVKWVQLGGHTSEGTGFNGGVPAVIGTDGYLYVFVYDMKNTGGTTVTVNALLKINPNTWVLDGYQILSSRPRLLLPLTSGGLFGVSNGDNAYRISAGFDSIISVLKSGSAAFGGTIPSRFGFVCGEDSFITFSDEAAGSNLCKVVVNVGANTYTKTDYTLNNNLDYNQIRAHIGGMRNATTFFMRSNNTGSTRQVGIYNLSDASTVTRITESDRYGGVPKDGLLTTATDDMDPGYGGTDPYLWWMKNYQGTIE